MSFVLYFCFTKVKSNWIYHFVPSLSLNDLLWTLSMTTNIYLIYQLKFNLKNIPLYFLKAEIENVRCNLHSSNKHTFIGYEWSYWHTASPGNLVALPSFHSLETGDVSVWKQTFKLQHSAVCITALSLKPLHLYSELSRQDLHSICICITQVQSDLSLVTWIGGSGIFIGRTDLVGEKVKLVNSVRVEQQTYKYQFYTIF